MCSTSTPSCSSLENIRRVVSAIGQPEGIRAERLAEIERLFGMTGLRRLAPERNQPSSVAA